MTEQTYTAEQYDEMADDINSRHPEEVIPLLRQAAQMMRKERQTIPRYRAIGYDPDTRCAEMIADSEGAWVHVLDMEETTHEREPSIDASTHEPWYKQRDRQLSDVMFTDSRAGRSIDRNKRDAVKVTNEDVFLAVQAFVQGAKAIHAVDHELTKEEEEIAIAGMRAALEFFAANLS